MKTRSHSQRHSRGGFTLIELLLVFGIISILATLFTPALNTVREKADTLVCISNLRAFGVAIQAAIVDNDNTIPYVEIDPADPVYDPEKVELIQTQPKSLIETFKPYGIPSATFNARRISRAQTISPNMDRVINGARLWTANPAKHRFSMEGAARSL